MQYLKHYIPFRFHVYHLLLDIKDDEDETFLKVQGPCCACRCCTEMNFDVCPHMFTCCWFGSQTNSAYAIAIWRRRCCRPHWCCCTCVVLLAWLMPVTSRVAHMGTYIPIYAKQIYGLCVQFGRHFCIQHIYGNNMWNICWSGLCFGTYMQQYHILMAIQKEESVTYICNVAAIVVQWHMTITWNVVCKYVYSPSVCTVLVTSYVGHISTYIPHIQPWKI